MGSCCITSGMCAGNSLSVDEPDVECLPPLRTKRGPELIVGRSTAACCDRMGFCARNDVPEVKDVSCSAPTSLVADAEHVVGRTEEECCARTGLCIGNTDTTAEPDIVCAAPAVLRDDAADRVGRSAEQHGPCCKVTGMCAGNSDVEKEPDVFCGGTFALVDGATHVPRGSPYEEVFRCCQALCEDGKEVMQCQCGEFSPETMDTTAGQVIVVAILAVLVTILRVCGMVHYARAYSYKYCDGGPYSFLDRDERMGV